LRVRFSPGTPKEGWPSGKAPASKAGGRKPSQVRILYPPPGSRSLMDKAPASGAGDASSILAGSTWQVKREKLKVKREFSAGGVVFRREPEGVLWLVVKPKGSEQWRLPKGKIEKGEDSAQTALREVKEEGGVEAKILSKIGNIKYFYVEDGQRIFKTVTFYLMEYIQEAQEGFCWETEEIAWLPFEEAKEKLAFKNEKGILEEANLAFGN
jgi:8-oxo-dGTP pyrophosphatase MutT (NUDIX family)